LLGSAATITFNLTDARTPYGYVFDYIERFGLNRQIKLGVALPTLEHRNVHAQWGEMPAIAEHIMTLFREGRQRQITVGFECGVPYCLFNEAQHAELGNVCVSHCGSRLDITPAGMVINCLPLSRVAAVPFRDFDNYRIAREWFQRQQSPYRQVGSTARCLFCAHRLEGLCSACLAFGMGDYARIPLPPLPASQFKDPAQSESSGDGAARNQEGMEAEGNVASVISQTN
jgi:hypothetical protein